MPIPPADDAPVLDQAKARDLFGRLPEPVRFRCGLGALMAERLAAYLGLPDLVCQGIAVGARLQDIGLLQSQGAEHPELGYRALSGYRMIWGEVLPIVRYHHAPSAPAATLEAQIVGLIDFFCVCLLPADHRVGLPMELARRKLAESGYDPNLVEEFQEWLQTNDFILAIPPARPSRLEDGSWEWPELPAW